MKVSKATAYALHAMMYMVRHRTQLPVTAESIAKAEGIPCGYLSKILQQLARAGFLKGVRKNKRGYEFARPPEEISVLELVEVVEGGPTFSNCLFKHCECGGTTDSCHIYAQWFEAMEKMRKLLGETNLVAATWNHPEHRFVDSFAMGDSSK